MYIKGNIWGEGQWEGRMGTRDGDAGVCQNRSRYIEYMYKNIIMKPIICTTNKKE
jgi:hypothetical protein